MSQGEKIRQWVRSAFQNVVKRMDTYERAKKKPRPRRWRIWEGEEDEEYEDDEEDEDYEEDKEGVW